jgi:hypothetical protein
VDLCFGSRDIDGTPLVVAFLNPGVIAQGATVPVGPGDCRSVEDCRSETDVAIVEVLAGGERQRAQSGRIDLRQVVPGSRYVGTATLTFRSGTLGATFDVVPRPEP